MATSLRRMLFLLVLVLTLSILLWIIRRLVIALSILLIGDVLLLIGPRVIVLLSSVLRVIARTVLRLIVAVGIHLKLVKIEFVDSSLRRYVQENGCR